MSLAWDLVGEVSVSSATTQVDFSGLNFTSDDNLMIVADINNSNSGSTAIANRIFVNGDTTVTNYYSLRVLGYGASVLFSSENANTISAQVQGDKSLAIVNIKMTQSGYFVYQSNQHRTYVSPSADFMAGSRHGTSTFTISSITSLSVVSSEANGIGTGSNFKLYKFAGEVVADITVGTATTSVDITGLSIGKDNEYTLVSDISNASGGTSDYLLRVNGTTSGYYDQGFYATSTIYGGGRDADAYYSTVTNARSNVIYTPIKLTNSGHYTYQGKGTRNYGTSSVELINYYGTSTFTATSITALNIRASRTDGIGVGSRFQLIRMK